MRKLLTSLSMILVLLVPPSVRANPGYFTATLVRFVPTNNATDIFALIGSSTKTIAIRKIVISCSANSPAVYDIDMITRLAVDTGGTTVNAVVGKHDSSYEASTASAVSYTSNPVVGAPPSVIWPMKIVCADKTGNAPVGVHPMIRVLETAPIVLRGPSEQFVLNMNGNTIKAGTEIDFSVIWSEY